MKKYTLMFSMLLLIAFKTGDNKSQYNVPFSAMSITSSDIDFDGDNDIIIGHNYNNQTLWGGVSFLINNGDGAFFLNDSFYLYSWQTHIHSINLNSSPTPEIIARHFENETQYMAVLEYEQGSYITNLYNMSFGISGDNIGDIDGDGFTDIIVYSHNGQFWGIMYNEGNGAFSEPEYHYVTDYYPTDVACTDLNGDGRDDIAICGQSTIIYYSLNSGFDSLVREF